MRPKGVAWLHVVKFDGHRLESHKGWPEGTLFIRGGHDWTARFLHLSTEPAGLPICIVDAELVVMDEHGIADFARLQRTVSKRREDGLAFWASSPVARVRDIVTCLH